MKGKRVLVVEDEQFMQQTLRRNLSGSGYHVIVADTGKKALELTRSHEPDLILLDLNLPGKVQGLDFCREVRQWTQIPIIVISAVHSEKKKVEALDLGADDYLTKPFGTKELLARVRVCLRRASITETESEPQSEILTSDDGYLSLNIPRRQVRAGDQDVRLTPTEFELLRQLMLAAGKVLTHRSLLQSVWGPEYGEETDYLRVYIRQLRRKVERDPSHPRYILTEPGVGYVFRAEPERSSTQVQPDSTSGSPPTREENFLT